MVWFRGRFILPPGQADAVRHVRIDSCTPPAFALHHSPMRKVFKSDQQPKTAGSRHGSRPRNP